MGGKENRFNRLEAKDNPQVKRLIERLVQLIESEKFSDSRTVTPETVLAYHRIGSVLSESLTDCLWGDCAIDEVARQLGSRFPRYHLSRGKLYAIRSFYDCFPDEGFVRRYLSQIPWTSIIVIKSLNNRDLAREFAIRAVENKWSTAQLKKEIDRLAPAADEQKTEQNSTIPGVEVFRTAKVHLRLTHSQKHLF